MLPDSSTKRFVCKDGKQHIPLRVSEVLSAPVAILRDWRLIRLASHFMLLPRPWHLVMTFLSAMGTGFQLAGDE